MEMGVRWLRGSGVDRLETLEEVVPPCARVAVVGQENSFDVAVGFVIGPLVEKMETTLIRCWLTTPTRFHNIFF